MADVEPSDLAAAQAGVCREAHWEVVRLRKLAGDGLDLGGERNAGWNRRSPGASAVGRLTFRAGLLGSASSPTAISSVAENACHAYRIDRTRRIFSRLLT